MSSSRNPPSEVLGALGKGALEDDRVRLQIGNRKLGAIRLNDIPEVLRVLAKHAPGGAQFMHHMLRAADEFEQKSAGVEAKPSDSRKGRAAAHRNEN